MNTRPTALASPTVGTLLLASAAWFSLATASTASAEIITYQTTLTVRPDVAYTFVEYDDQGNPYPSHHDPASLLTPGDRFQLSFTINTAATMRVVELQLSDFYRWGEFDDLLVSSEMIPMPGNAGWLARGTQPLQSLYPGASTGFDGQGIGLISDYRSGWYESILQYSMVFNGQIDLARAGESFASLVGTLDGRVPIAIMSVGYPWGQIGAPTLDATPLARVVPAPGAVLVLGSATVMLARGRRRSPHQDGALAVRVSDIATCTLSCNAGSAPGA